MRLTTSNDGFAFPAQWSPVWMTALLSCAVLFVFFLDRATDAAPVQHLYYVPIILAGFRFTMRGGVTAALTSILLYHVANPHLLTFKYGEQDIVQVALFLAVGMVTAKLVDDRNRLRQLALTDDLTGLHNLRSFEAHLATMVRASREEHAPLSLLVLDVDHLKALNDRHGHLTGAEAVRTVGRIIGERLPPGAVACRYGGDEFAIAIPRCASRQGHRVAQDLCQAVNDCAPVLAGRPFAAGTISVSVGGTCAVVNRSATLREQSLLDLDLDAGEALFRAADTALYLAKASGRNRAWVNDIGAPNGSSNCPDHDSPGDMPG
jgi:diguanylate cyclase (GGDEF)-like protein